MKNYIKPTVDIVELRVEERIAVKCAPEYQTPSAANVVHNCSQVFGKS